MTKLLVSILFFTFVGIIFVFSQSITIFLIPPIGALPEGKTLIISRMNKTKFLDNADAMCRREIGYVNLLCRGITLGAIAENASIYAKLPFSEILYELSE